MITAGLSPRPFVPMLSVPREADDARLEKHRARLASSPLFAGLPQAVVDDLARRTQVRTRLAGAVLIAEDETGDVMYFLLEGRARALRSGESGREVTLALHGPGDFFGELSLLDGQARPSTVVAEENVVMLSLGRDALLEHLRAHPQTALNLLAELARRLRRSDQAVADLALHDVNKRLVRTLERLARQPGSGEETTEGLLLRRRPTQQDLANMVGSCRETVSRTFTSLIKQGLMVQRGRALLLTRRLLAA